MWMIECWRHVHNCEWSIVNEGHQIRAQILDEMVESQLYRKMESVSSKSLFVLFPSHVAECGPFCEVHVFTSPADVLQSAHSGSQIPKVSDSQTPNAHGGSKIVLCAGRDSHGNSCGKYLSNRSRLHGYTCSCLVWRGRNNCGNEGCNVRTNFSFDDLSPCRSNHRILMMRNGYRWIWQEKDDMRCRASMSCVKSMTDDMPVKIIFLITIFDQEAPCQLPDRKSWSGRFIFSISFFFPK